MREGFRYRLMAAVSLMCLALGTGHFFAAYADSIRFSYPMDFSWSTYAVYVATYATWSILFVLIYWILRRSGLHQSMVGCVGLYCMGLVVWLNVYGFFDQSNVSLIKGQPFDWRLKFYKDWSYNIWFLNVLIFSMFYGACLAYFYFERAQSLSSKALKLEAKQIEIELEKSRYQIQALQSQLSPHFLFNALSAVSFLGRSGDDRGVVKSVAQLADLLRYSIEASKKPLSTVRQEVDFMNDYVALQRLRFNDRFDYKITLGDIPLGAKIPVFTLQPLVENAFVHGDQLKGCINVTIDANALNQLEVCVENTKGNHEGHHGFGSGINNLMQRLQLHCSGRANLTVESEGRHYKSTLILPLGPDYVN